MAFQTYPPTEKMHQIIARTAMFVSKHGGQSEIVLRVKQGKNPLFGFLMPDDHLHLYFRFLVDHQELLQTENDEKPHREEKISDGGGALSLLGSLYGNGEDDDGAIENSSVSKPHASGEPFEASAPISRGSEYTESPASTCLKDESASKRIIPSKEKAATTKKSSKSVSSSGTKKVDDKLLASSVPSIPKTEPLMVEPPSDLKRLVDKIVEFIIKNGKQFEAVLMEQDSGHGRFPFLLPTNQYHPYYLKVLEKAQESKLTGKSFPSDKDRHGQEKKTSLSKEIDTQSAGCDIPYDSDRKEKFKMVLGKTKKDGPDPPSKTTSHQQQFGVAVDAAAAAAILQAATRGIKNPNFGFLSTSSLNGNHSQGRSSSDRIQKSDHNTDQTVGVPVASAIAKTIALEAASEADSSEAHLTREQKLKAERLKRAKMFVAMLKSGGPAKTEFSRGLSVEPQESGDVSRSAEEAVVNLVAREREGSSAPVDVDKIEKSEKKHSGDELERRSKRKYRARSSRHEGEEEDEDDDDDNDEDTDDEKAVDGDHLKRKHRKDEGREQKNDDDDDKCARKKHRSHRSSRGEIDRVDEEEGDDKYSRKKRRADYSSREEFDGERRDDKYSRKKRLSSCEEINVEYEKDDEKKRRHRSRQSSSHEGTDEDDEDDKYTRKKHRSSHRETNDEDENDDDKYSRKKHHSHRSSREIDDEEDDDGKERDDKRSHKKHHKSHRSSRHTKKDGHRKRHTSSKEKSSRRHRHKHEDDRSSDEEDDKVREDRSRSDDNKHHKKKKASQVELEEGEICSKLLEGKSMKGGTSMVSLGGAGRDASVDDSFNSSSHHQDLTATAAAPSNSSQVTVVPDDLRAKVRAMLRATM